MSSCTTLLVIDPQNDFCDLPEEWRADAAAGGSTEPEPNSLAPLVEVEARHIARVLAHAQGHIGEAARILGVHRNTLARKIKEYRL